MSPLQSASVVIPPKALSPCSSHLKPHLFLPWETCVCDLCCSILHHPTITSFTVSIHRIRARWGLPRSPDTSKSELFDDYSLDTQVNRFVYLCSMLALCSSNTSAWWCHWPFVWWLYRMPFASCYFFQGCTDAVSKADCLSFPPLASESWVILCCVKLFSTWINFWSIHGFHSLNANSIPPQVWQPKIPLFPGSIFVPS